MDEPVEHPEKMNWLGDRVTIFVHIDLSRPHSNVTVDLGGVPPMMALIPMRRAYSAVEAKAMCDEDVVLRFQDATTVVTLSENEPENEPEPEVEE